MGNQKWVHRVLTNKEVDEHITKYRESLRVESYDRWPHLQILLKDKDGKTFFKTLGRTRKDIFKRHDLVLMDNQSGYMNVAWYKFKEVNHG